MRVFVAGATGAIGRPLVRELIARGHAVVGLTRTEEAAAALRAAGAEAAVADVFDSERLTAAVVRAKPDAVIHQLTKIQRVVDLRRLARDLAATNRLRVEGTRILAAAAVKAGAMRFLSQSIAFAYAPEGPTPLAAEAEPIWTEGPRATRPLAEALVALERTTLETPSLSGTVLRYGYFMGPGTAYAPGGGLFEAVSRRHVPIPGRGTGVFSFIHVDDAARATVLALEKRATGVFNVVDDTPIAFGDFLPAYAQSIGAARPRRVPAFLVRLGAGAYGALVLLRQRGASNEKARSALGFAPRYRSWREAMAGSVTSPSLSAAVR
jgi:nucleoside-diphosphate-sugar epimerase